MKEKANGVLDRGVESVVVFENDEDEHVATFDDLGPALGVIVGVLSAEGLHGLVIDRQVHVGEVHEFNVESTAGHGKVAKPLGDRFADPTRSSAANDDLEKRTRRGHLGSRTSSVRRLLAHRDVGMVRRFESFSSEKFYFIQKLEVEWLIFVVLCSY